MGLFDGFSGSEEGLRNSAYEAIKAEFDKQGLNYGEDTSEDGEDHILRMRQKLDNGSVVSIAIVVTENGDTNDFIKIKYFDLVRLGEKAEPTVFHEKLNEWNSEYRYVKFVVDDDQDVVVDIDLPLDLHVGAFQVESFMSMVGVGLQVIEEVYPDPMKLRWSRARQMRRESPHPKTMRKSCNAKDFLLVTALFLSLSASLGMVDLRYF